MRILIVEDELPAQRLLARYLVEVIPSATIIGVLQSVKETVEWLRSNEHPDIIFMDVQLSDGLCFNIFEHIKPDSFVIFTTAYNQYAIQAFKANAIDYLLKPIQKEHIRAAITKVNEQSRLYQKLNMQDFDVQKFMEILKESRHHYRERFMVKEPDGWSKLNVDDIAFFYLDNKNTVAVDFKSNRHVLDFNLNQIMESLNPRSFFRTNRQTIVNIQAIQKIEPWFNGKLLVKTTPRHREKVIVVREKAALFRAWFNDF